MTEQNQGVPVPTDQELVVPGTGGFVDQERLQQREENLTKVREQMALAEKVNAGNRLREGVDIDHVTELGHYTGYVKFKRPDTKGYIKIGAHRAQLLQANFIDENGNFQRVDPIYIDESTHYAAQVVATLHFVIAQDAEIPEWIKTPESQYDFDILAHVYGRFLEWVNSFRTKRPADGEGDSSTTGTTPPVAG